MSETNRVERPVMPQRKTLNQWSRDELMKLPVRAWDADSEYDSLMTISTRRKHDSGWATMAIIGVVDSQPVEIACACCDDIEWKMPPMFCVGTYSVGQMRMDCALWVSLSASQSMEPMFLDLVGIPVAVLLSWV